MSDIFQDSDLSAYRKGVVRPEFERMLQAVKAREVEVVVAWKLDRISRRIRDFARLDEECETAGAHIVTVADSIDTSTSAGRVVASIMTALARAESENISVRVARKAREMAQAGVPSSGGNRPFGYTIDRSAAVEPEAAIIREVAARLLAGESVRGVCMDLARRGIVSSSNKPWQQGPLKRMITSSLLSAQREHEGILTPGMWPPILAPSETQRLRAVLRNPLRRKSFSNARSYLLSGMLTCGLCGERLIARPRLDGRRRYVCAKRPASVSCGRLARLAEPTEEFVYEAVCIALEGVNLRDTTTKALPEASELGESNQNDEESLLGLIEDYANNLFTRGEFFAARDIINTRLEANRTTLRRLTGDAVLTGLAGGEALHLRWLTETLQWKRAVLAAVIDHVVIEPAVKGKITFDPSLIRIVWRH